jgi:4-carboxymuconolactone decarboxylase
MRTFLKIISVVLMFSGNTNAQQYLSAREQHIVTISSFTAKGDLTSLNNALRAGLDSGLTINEIKEVLVHLYAYTGFPRSLQGINTFLAVLNDRKAKGITDNVGKTASLINDSLSRYERGRKVLESLTGRKETGPKTGYAAFSPEIEVFLKEHLFADLFTRDILSYSDREIATIAALINLGGVEPMMQSHMRIALNIGLNESKLDQLVAIIEKKVGKYEASTARRVLLNVTGKADAQKDAGNMSLFERGVRAPADRFTGTVWVNMLVEPTEGLGHSAGSVTFEPGARTNWHKHPGGQVLLVTNGKGYYQEKSLPVKIIYKGDVVKCPPGVEHWHGASPDREMSHVAISGNIDKGAVVWGEKVTEEQYKSMK